MLWLAFEALVALGLLLFLMWWTLAPVKRREDVAAKRSDDSVE